MFDILNYFFIMNIVYSFFNQRRNMGDIYFVDDSEYKNPETLALHGGNYRFDPVTSAVTVPIFRSTSFQFRDTENAANLFALKEFGNI